MKALFSGLIALVSVSASAVVISPIRPGNEIIDPPRIEAAWNGATTFEDSIVRKVSVVDEEAEATDEMNFLDSGEFDPNSPDAERILEMYDRYYEAETGESAYPTGRTDDLVHQIGGCYRDSCAVWAHVSKSRQRITIYVNGRPIGLADNRTSTGLGSSTPNFDKHPDGRIYNRYSSRKYPGGDYNGLGNMPYAVFIRGGFAIHGTPKGNWSKLGRKASHGCIRTHPSTGKLFNQLVRQYGVRNTWITVTN